jgi:hypothetical protein
MDEHRCIRKQVCLALALLGLDRFLLVGVDSQVVLTHRIYDWVTALFNNLRAARFLVNALLFHSVLTSKNWLFECLVVVKTEMVVFSLWCHLANSSKPNRFSL